MPMPMMTDRGRRKMTWSTSAQENPIARAPHQLLYPENFPRGQGRRAMSRQNVRGAGISHSRVGAQGPNATRW